jgi:hypothetical protein
VEHIFGVPALEAHELPFNGSVLQEWNYLDTDPVPFTNTPQKSDTHECLAREPRAQVQLGRFLNEGLFYAACSTPCSSPTCPDTNDWLGPD